MEKVICKMHHPGSYLLNHWITDISADVVEVDVDALWAALLDPQKDILGAVVNGMMEA